MGLFRRRRHLMDSFDPAPPIPNDRPLSFMDEHDDPALMDVEMSPRHPWRPASAAAQLAEEIYARREPTVGPTTPSGASDAYLHVGGGIRAVRCPCDCGGITYRQSEPNRLLRAFAELIAGIDRTVQIGGNMVLNDAIGIPYARVRGELTPDGLWPAESYERVIRQHLGL
jgi:hypothetical protein